MSILNESSKFISSIKDEWKTKKSEELYTILKVTISFDQYTYVKNIINGMFDIATDKWWLDNSYFLVYPLTKESAKIIF